ncbi:RHS repeat-associated core domain-containing protein [Luteimicrobium album]|nr:RHS repeat-associated core domain-containing protein [Luteimicrobium album]
MLNTSTQTLSAKRYYSFAGQTVAVRTGTGLAGVSTLVADPQGTALLSIANGTNVVSRRYTDPFGNVRGSKPAWPGDHQMLDKVLDASGLTQVGARFLDTATGRFVSVDPVLDTTNPQQWNAYAYAGNNPVTFSDPSGLMIVNPHPDGMTDAQWGRASKGDDPGPGMAPAQPSSVANSHYQAATVTPPVKAPVAKKQHWYNTAGNWVRDATADVVNAAASFGNAMINHPWAGTGFIAGVGTMFEGGGTILGGGSRVSPASGAWSEARRSRLASPR